MMKIYPDILGGANRTAPGLKHTQYTVESGHKKRNRTRHFDYDIQDDQIMLLVAY